MRQTLWSHLHPCTWSSVCGSWAVTCRRWFDLITSRVKCILYDDIQWDGARKVSHVQSSLRQLLMSKPYCYFMAGLNMCDSNYIYCMRSLMWGCELELCILRMAILCKCIEVHWGHSVVGMVIMVVCYTQKRVGEVAWHLSQGLGIIYLYSTTCLHMYSWLSARVGTVHIHCLKHYGDLFLMTTILLMK